MQKIKKNNEKAALRTEWGMDRLMKDRAEFTEPSGRAVGPKVS